MFDWSGKNAAKSGKSQGILISCVSGNPVMRISIVNNWDALSKHWKESRLNSMGLLTHSHNMVNHCLSA